MTYIHITLSPSSELSLTVSLQYSVCEIVCLSECGQNAYGKVGGRHLFYGTLHHTPKHPYHPADGMEWKQKLYKYKMKTVGQMEWNGGCIDM